MTKPRLALAVQGRGAPRPRDTTGATTPRSYLFDELFVKKYDESVLDTAPQHPLGRRVPGWARLAHEIYRRRDEYDALVTWSERVTLASMAVSALMRGRAKPHIAMMYWFSRPSVRYLMRTLGNDLQAIITWSTVQRRYAIERLGIDAKKIYLVKHFVDQLFWNSSDLPSDMICAAGAEMRDYPTLLEALRGLDMKCHIATDHVRIDRLGFGRRVSADDLARHTSSRVTVGRRSAQDLRALYARSRFVVVPLRASDTDNGITVILEAMAMGKAVICSRTRGQVDVIQDGVHGLFVPVGDAVALRETILALWNDPERATMMGRAGRAYIEKHHSLDKFCRDVQLAIDASLEGRVAAHDGSIQDSLKASQVFSPS